MKKERIQILREAVTNIVRILSHKHGITVTQQGAKAFVDYDTNTARILRVNIPHLPDDASDELILAIHGFLDHEVAHILFSDFRVLAKGSKDKTLGKFHNILEDGFIERRMREEFNGSGFNLSNVSQFWLTNYTDKQFDKALAMGDPDVLFSTLFVPASRAWGGHLVFIDYMKDKWHLIEEHVKIIGDDIIQRIPTLNSTAETLEVAQEIIKRLQQAAQPQPKQGKESQKGGQPQKGESQKGESKGDGQSQQGESQESESRSKKGKPKKEGESEENKPKKEGESEEGESEEEGEEQSNSGLKKEEGEKEEGEKEEGEKEEGEKEEGEKEEGEGSGGSEEQEESKEEGGSQSSEEQSEEPSGEQGEEPSGEQGEERGGGKTQQSNESQQSEESSENAGNAGGGGSEQGAMPINLGKIEEELKKHNFDEGISKILTDIATKTVRNAPYSVFTTEYDRVEPYRPPSDEHRYVTAMQDRVDHMLGVLQKDLERAVCARTISRWNPGRRTGKLNPKAISRLAIGVSRPDLADDRIFRKRQLEMSKDVAVSIVVDCSGSMMQKNKMLTAADTAYGIASVLGRLNITCEIIGFTTGDLPLKVRNEISNDQMRGIYWSRLDSLYMPIFKAFNEQVDSVVRQRLALWPVTEGSRGLHGGNGMNYNIDGESLEVAARRLMSRPEEGKIMIVLSDGMPNGCRGSDKGAIIEHCGTVVKKLEKAGINIVGIGINSDSVRSYYRKYVRINGVSELPGAVMRQLKSLLLAS